MADGDERVAAAVVSPAGALASPSDALRPRAAASSHAIGKLVGWVDGAGPVVAFEGAQGPIAARTIVPLDADVVAQAIAAGREVLLAFDGDRADAPIILGWLEPTTPASTPGGASVDATVDGKRVVIQGSDEIVLQCGLASITLRRNGRVVIRGVEVESRARGTNKVRGGSVLIN